MQFSINPDCFRSSKRLDLFSLQMQLISEVVEGAEGEEEEKRLLTMTMTNTILSEESTEVELLKLGSM